MERNTIVNSLINIKINENSVTLQFYGIMQVTLVSSFISK